jgi:pimeloyl-ACP methyl ester carboxylesterase
MNKAQPSDMLSKKDLKGLRDTPTLFVWGKHEKVLHAHGLLFFRRYLSSKSTAFYCDEEFGHVPFLDNPKRLLAIMQDFFEGACDGNKGVGPAVLRG